MRVSSERYRYFIAINFEPSFCFGQLITDMLSIFSKLAPGMGITFALPQILFCYLVVLKINLNQELHQAGA